MKNNKGQTLVLFIIFIPVLLLLAAFIIDTGLIIKESTRLKAATKTVLQDVYYNENKNDNKIIRLLNQNNIPTDNLEIEIDENKINIKNEYKIESMFGKIIGIKDYEIKIDITATDDNGNLKYK